MIIFLSPTPTDLMSKADLEFIDSFKVFPSSVFILISTLLAIFSLFKFKNRLLQLKLLRFSRASLGFVVIISFALNRLWLIVYYAPLLLPWILLILSSYFIRKDEKLVKSADRIR